MIQSVFALIFSTQLRKLNFLFIQTKSFIIFTPVLLVPGFEQVGFCEDCTIAFLLCNNVFQYQNYELRDLGGRLNCFSLLQIANIVIITALNSVLKNAFTNVITYQWQSVCECVRISGSLSVSVYFQDNIFCLQLLHLKSEEKKITNNFHDFIIFQVTK